MAPTRRLILVALIAAVALAAYPGDLGVGFWAAFAVVNGVLAAVWLVDWLAAPSLTDVAIGREHPPIVVQGRESEIAWRVTNNSSRRVRLSVADALPPSFNAPHRRFAVTLAPAASSVARVGIRPERRGRKKLADLVVRSRGPLGLALHEHRVSAPTTLRIHPPFRSKQEAELKIRSARMLDVGLRNARGIGGGTEFEQLREYTVDDEFRRVDWAASARVGRPIVRTYRPERNQNVLILMDNGRLSATQTGGYPRLEHNIDAAMMLGEVATRLGDKVGMVTFDREVRSVVPLSRRADQVSRLTEAMFDLQPVLAESDYVAAFTHTLARFRRRMLIVLLTELSAPALTQSLMPAMRLIVRRHLVVVGSVVDPTIALWADGPAEDEAQAYRKAAAVDSLRDRERVSAQLSALGVTVVDAQPGRLSGELADVYLKVKSMGRL